MLSSLFTMEITRNHIHNSYLHYQSGINGLRVTSGECGITHCIVLKAHNRFLYFKKLINKFFLHKLLINKILEYGINLQVIQEPHIQRCETVASLENRSIPPYFINK